ncbi:MAG: hypothetical protein RL442_7 [Pseudomonadota bacterium]|jgi:hypothetical protein
MNFKTLEMPKYVGGYQIGGPNALQFNLKHKPCWLHRKMAAWFFGFVWVDL